MKSGDFDINIPNLITISRIVLTPVFVILLLKDLRFAAFVVFTVAGISDALDGLIARCFNKRTVLGSYLDPIADKLLLVSAFVCLAVLEIIPEWLAVIVLSRDIVIVLGIAVFSITDIHVEMRPSLVSKCTTLFQIATVILSLLEPKIKIALFSENLLYWFTAGLTVLSGFHYLYHGLNILQNSLGNSQGRK
ncbi:MAG: CDP-alcohol phosphatidyltransferase family protein [Desulfobacterales bacterium]|nr:CDP-alcohol phosphatidyltransferase family protein [Desulfobacterales bacterium]MDD4073387.1 CDP-alcohol phosphatidyltransferase family protein [Desulfobacterales bacterium]MDD4394119.1 CDP-alcohol phosphatidyltransferase family protein [Desulfobacterales bacterium]